MIDSSERYYYAKTHFDRHGIVAGEMKIDLPKMMARKDEVVKQLTGGVGFLRQATPCSDHAFLV